MSVCLRRSQLIRLLLLCAALTLVACEGSSPRAKRSKTTSTTPQGPGADADRAPGGTPAADDGASAEATPKKAPGIKVLSPDDPLRKAVAADSEAERLKKRRAWPVDQPRTQKELRTTTCSNFLGNTESIITSSQKALKVRPDDPTFTRKLGETLFFKGQTFGDLDLMQQGIELLSKLIEAKPDDPELRLSRANMQQTMHRFAEARADLDHVATLTPDSRALKAQRQALDLATGQNLDAAIEAMKIAYRGGASFDNYVSTAQAQTVLGNKLLAVRYHSMAEATFRGVAPIPLSWLNVQRGLLAMHTGDYEAAHTFFKVGYERCPEYPMAAEHLAEIEGRLGNTERAIELYAGVIEQTNNPEFMGALAEIYLEQGKTEEAKALIERADKRNRELIEKYPEAMYWHAADFYLGLGEDPKLALELLRKNHAIRPTAESHQMLAEALLANGEVEEAATVVGSLLGMNAEFAEKYWTAARVALAKNDAEAAEKHAAKARELNPRIEDLEGPLSEAAAPEKKEDGVQ